MKRLRLFVLALLGAWFWGAVAADAPAIVQHTLPNGMQVIVKVDRRAPTAVHMLWGRVGSMDEGDGHSGLAHVLEHMSFNGTQHFPKQDIVNFMESIGMRFGSDLNASTSFDETIYQLQVPTDKPEPLEKALQIMEDWAHANTLDDKDTQGPLWTDQFSNLLQIVK